MKNAEMVTFGGSGLNRAAELRVQPDRLAELRTHPETRFLPLWRGRPLLGGASLSGLVLLAPGHDVLSLATEAPVFLGLEGGAARFAVDISAWQPDEYDPALLKRFFDPTEWRHPGLPDDQAFCELRAVMARLTPREAELAATAKAILQWHRSHGYCANCGAKSAIFMAGWQRNCPECDTRHFPRTDPVVIMLITHGNDVLLGRSVGWPDGVYSLLAGFVEPGETLEAAVRREVHEETGISVGPVGYLASQPWPFPASLMVGCSGRALNREIRIDPDEIEDAIWVSREELMMAFAGEKPELLPARKGSIAHFLLSNWLADRLD